MFFELIGPALLLKGESVPVTTGGPGGEPVWKGGQARPQARPRSKPTAQPGAANVM